jgi:hypothetical protein
VLAVVAVESSGGSEESEPLPVDFGGEPALVSALVGRSARPDRLEVAEESCDWDWVVRAREERRVGEVPAISRRSGLESVAVASQAVDDQSLRVEAATAWYSIEYRGRRRVGSRVVSRSSLVGGQKEDGWKGSWRATATRRGSSS